MPKQKYSREQIIEDWLNYYPIRQVEYDTNDNNLVVLIVPHTQNWFARKFLPKPKNSAKQIQLDEIGTFIWTLLDGNHSLQLICEKLEKKFNERVSPCRERTILFAQQLYKQKFIKIYLKNEDAPTN